LASHSGKVVMWSLAGALVSGSRLSRGVFGVFADLNFLASIWTSSATNFCEFLYCVRYFVAMYCIEWI